MNKLFNFFKITGLVKFLSLISLKGKKNLKILFFFMIVGSLLEILSIGILIPLINFIFDPNSNDSIMNVQGFEIINFLANFDYVNLILFFIFVIYLIKSMFMIFYQYFNTKVLLNMSVDIKTYLFENYLNKNYLFHLNNNSSLLIRNVQNEIDVLMANYVSPILVFSLTTLNIVFICFFLLYYSFVTSLVVIIIFGITGLILNFSVRKILRVIGERRKFFSYSVLKNLRQSFTLIKEIKINSKENYFSNKLTSDNSIMAKLGIKRTVIGSLPRIIFELLFVIIVLSSIYYMNSSNTSFENFFFITYSLCNSCI
jgi:ABC-type multidrug transport system fused ATPase/permease subunit